MATARSYGIGWMLLLLALLVGVAHGSVGEQKDEQRLIQNANAHPISAPCPVKFASVDYSSVTRACKAPQYNLKECCGSFTAMACKYSKHVNDYSTTCPIEFVSFLNLAGSYPDGVFIGRCNEDGQYLLCPK